MRPSRHSASGGLTNTEDIHPPMLYEPNRTIIQPEWAVATQGDKRITLVEECCDAVAGAVHLLLHTSYRN